MIRAKLSSKKSEGKTSHRIVSSKQTITFRKYDVGKMEELTRENAKILQKIVEARQINFKARHQLVGTIKKDEDRSRSVRDALARASVRRQSDIAMDNQRIAVKLFTQKPTYELLKFEKDHKDHKDRI